MFLTLEIVKTLSIDINPLVGHRGFKIITDSRIRSFICKGPKYRFPFQKTSNHVVGKLQAPYKTFVIAGVNESMLNLMP